MAPKGEAAEKGEKKAKKSKNDGPKRGACANGHSTAIDALYAIAPLFA